MRYISTRGNAPILSFEDVLLQGLADDGGLYVPEALPHFSKEEIEGLKGKSYEDIAEFVLAPFVGESFTPSELRTHIDKVYSKFSHFERAPLTKLSDNHYLLELFHGPTLAFKDFAMQLIGSLFEDVLARRNRRLTIIGATSGDTGSAAIEAFKGLENVNVFILFPEGRVSDVQRRQMTTSSASNVFPLAVTGDFDDCQALVKACFNDHEFRDNISLGGVNSINWGRVMAQIVYYFTSAVKLGAPQKKISFTVPSGNFGDIYAGYCAKHMGLPIEDLIVATNQNDILHRVISSGSYKKTSVSSSISPSIDIQVSSNFERLLFDISGRNPEAVKTYMTTLENEGGYQLDDEHLAKLRFEFKSGRASEEETMKEIGLTLRETGELLCPHSAVAVKVAKENLSSGLMITLATAHPAKFPDAVEQSSGQIPHLPAHMADIFERKEVYETLPDELSALQEYVHARVI